MGKDKVKDSSKLLETPEEKMKRRAEKKAKKEEKKRKQDELYGYTNESNPFGDSHLTEKFVWKLKREKEKKMGLNPDKLDSERDKRRSEEIRQEIEKVKRRREERELEKQQWEEEKARLQREQDSLAYQDWEKKEDEFHLKQAKSAAEVRIQQGRPKPIDMLYQQLKMDGTVEFDYQMNEPYKIFKGLTLQQLEELKNDVRVFLELEENNRDFWKALMVVCEDELATARKEQEMEKARTTGKDAMRFEEHTGVHKSVSDDVQNVFKGKTSAQLEDLHKQIVQNLESGQAMDVEYWETLLKKLVVYQAKAKLKEIHASLLKKKLSQLEDMQRTVTTRTSPTSPPSPPQKEIKEKEKSKKERFHGDSDEEKGGLSPQLVHSLEAGEEVVDADTDRALLEEQRQQVLNVEAKKLRIRPSDLREFRDKQLTEDEMYRLESEKAMEESEEQFNDDMPVPAQVYSWNDKYRPRKPKFFNRIHTGYEWNKYNQTHYDHDNPPPKVVQGYKFNIFYPDLLEKHVAPQYFVEPGPTPDTCTLRFHAGPPYEDVAFKIVNREWEYSHKKGFKCTFERGILHLWFNFKRYRYRR